ncbi:hypothetical protein FOH24_12580 [Acetobacter tropicalis]|nr:hypothetical protein FOH22_14455 [Acetobacter tropicalis]KAA8388553.1 hypothetical protein FOH24_12580 [Acetobacter tropicalis]
MYFSIHARPVRHPQCLQSQAQVHAERTGRWHANVTPLRSGADLRLVSLVRLLARQAARDFVNAEVEAVRRRDLQD